MANTINKILREVNQKRKEAVIDREWTKQHKGSYFEGIRDGLERTIVALNEIEQVIMQSEEDENEITLRKEALISTIILEYRTVIESQKISDEYEEIFHKGYAQALNTILTTSGKLNKEEEKEIREWKEKAVKN